MRIDQVIRKARKNEALEKMQVAAFGSWQIVEVIRGAVNEKNKPQSLNDYFKMLGLEEKNEEMTKRQRKQHIEKAVTTAHEILQLDKRQRGEINAD